MNNGTKPSMELICEDASVCFSKPMDRFEHSFCIRIFGARVPLLSSYVEDPLATWPTDPAIQQLVLEPIGPPSFPDVALGVGMSGQGHWSLAGQWKQEGIGPSAFEFDYACKTQPPVGFLGSTYRLSQSLLSQGTRLERYEVSPKEWTGWFLVPTLHSRYQLTIQVLLGKLTWSSDTQQIAIEAEDQSLRSSEKPTTQRWCYRVAWLSCHE